MADDSPSSSASPDPGEPEDQASTSTWRERAATGLRGEHEIITFKELCRREATLFDGPPAHTPADRQATAGPEPPTPFRVDVGASGEPWMSATSRDRFGLALSGGGIRSATFNLGLLQALASLGILAHVNYLATVSGGGYIGGFWTRWIARRTLAGQPTGGAHFPVDGRHGGGEVAEVRHLREFSRFLLPRLGIHRTEFWAAVMTVLGGLLPSLVAALAVLTLGWGGWRLVEAQLHRPDPWGYRAFAILLFVFFVACEATWLRRAKRQAPVPGETASDAPPVELWGYSMACGAGLVVASVAWALRNSTWMEASPGARVLLEGDFGPAVVLGAWALVLLVLRTLTGRFVRDWSEVGVSLIAGLERSLSRVLALTAALSVLGLLWWAGGHLSRFSLTLTAGSTPLLAALFAWARKWLSEPTVETRGTRVVQIAVQHLKRATPRVLATLVWLLMVFLMGAAVRWISDGTIDSSFGYLMAAAAGIVLLTMWWFDPARVGLHEFYRSRISRCYLGASNTATSGDEHLRAARNRSVNELPNDDLTLGDLRAARVRPLHLVCTAANDLSGDHLASLYRGARSAVLSANGISIGNETAQLEHLRFSAALTASAAAFNSHMGRVSMSLGPSVAFLMSTLNLRLGLWVPHPQNPWRKSFFFPGRFFLLELFGYSRADRRHLHLSDGNHFENFGLYELIRRHCRWIIVSDCGADPSVTFDDLANVQRRVREDFGVEIELDVAPLRPDAEGRSRQHAVAGTIHYDGPNGADKGSLLFFKPTLTGDESADVLHYKTKMQTFPHESTGDQFFDEAQWESYRRLGEHAGWSTLAFAETLKREHASFSDRLFAAIRERLHPAAEGHRDTFVEMSARCAELESDVFANGPEGLRQELFPEAVDLASNQALPGPLDDEIASLGYLVRAIQIMEDVWVASDLDRYWSHPLNEGWMNYFQRWASTPTFRRWWPILRSIYSNGFRDFAKDRFGVSVRDEQARPDSDAGYDGTRLSLHVVDNLDRFRHGHAWRQYIQRSAAPDLQGVTVLAYRMRLADGIGGTSPGTIDVGFALVREAGDAASRTATVQAQHFYVPPALMGAGIISRQLDAVLDHYQRRGVRQMTVVFGEGAAKPVRGRAAREARVREIEFFKSRGFEPPAQQGATLGDLSLTRRLV